MYTKVYNIITYNIDGKQLVKIVCVGGTRARANRNCETRYGTCTYVVHVYYIILVTYRIVFALIYMYTSSSLASIWDKVTIYARAKFFNDSS